MTTVAWDGETLASDSQVQDHHICPDPYQKLYRVGGAIIGCAGSVTEWTQAVEWLRAGASPEFKPKLTDISLLLVRANGRAFYLEGDLVPMRAGKLAAVGTGSGFALAAMLAGASAPEAVRIACRLDVGSGGRVQTLRLTAPRRSR